MLAIIALLALLALLAVGCTAVALAEPVVRATLPAAAAFPMPDTVRSMSASCGVAAAVTHEQKLELAERLLQLDERESVESVSLSTPPRLAARRIDSSRCPCCEALRQVRSIDLASESNRIEALVSLVSRTQLRCDSHLGMPPPLSSVDQRIFQFIRIAP